MNAETWKEQLGTPEQQKQKVKRNLFKEVGSGNMDTESQESDNGSEEIERKSQMATLLPDVTHPLYEVEAQQKSSSSVGGRSTKRHFCTYCKTEIAKLPNHLEAKHKNEELVKKLMSIPKGNVARKEILDIIRARGAHEFNMNRIYNKGNLKVARRSKRERSGDDYTPCPNCTRQVVKRKLHRHHFNCTQRYHIQGDRILHLKSKQIQGNVHSDANPILKYRVFPFFRDDACTRAIRYDQLIIAYGNYMCQKYASSVHHDQMTRANMRYMGNLILKAKSITSVATDFASLLTPAMHDTVVQAIHGLTGFCADTGTYQIPSAATALVGLCKRAVIIWKAQCVKKGNHESIQEAEEFNMLFTGESARCIHKVALENRTKVRRQQRITLPSLYDTELLTVFLKRNTVRCLQELTSDNFCYRTWKDLASYLLVSIVLFNRRRPGEVERIELTDYKSAVEVNKTDEEYKQFTNEEKNLAQQYQLFVIRGKLNRSVPVILNRSMKKALTVLLKHREEANVPKSNPYVFGIPSESTIRPKYLRVYQLLPHFANLCGAEHPDTLRATALRKHFATLSATYNLPENVTTDIADHMGHAIQVHKGVYRQCTIRRNVLGVAKMLKLAQGNPKADELSDNDNLSDNTPVKFSPSDGIEKCKVVAQKNSAIPLKNRKYRKTIDIRTPSKKLGINTKRATLGLRPRKELGKNLLKTPDKLSPRRLLALRQNETRYIRWGVSAIQALKKAFGQQLQEKRLPSTHEVQQAKCVHPPLKGRSDRSIVAAVGNLLKKNRRIAEYQNTSLCNKACVDY